MDRHVSRYVDRQGCGKWGRGGVTFAKECRITRSWYAGCRVWVAVAACKCANGTLAMYLIAVRISGCQGVGPWLCLGVTKKGGGEKGEGEKKKKEWEERRDSGKEEDIASLIRKVSCVPWS